MTPHPLAPAWPHIAGVACLLLVGGCGSLLPKAQSQPAFYALDAAPAAPREPAAQRSIPNPIPGPSAAPIAVPIAAPTLIVNPPRAAAGFDSPRILYVREAHRLEYFAHSDWVDTPARMLAPLIVDALASSAVFGAVVLTPSAAAGDLRLDSEIVRLQHDFGAAPSRVRFTLRATLVDDATRRVLALREFDTTVAATSEDARGGVAAANTAVQAVLAELAVFCADAARAWPPPRAVPEPQAVRAARPAPGR